MINKFEKLLSDKKVRYLLIGGSSAFFEYISFILLNMVLANVVVSNVISFIIGLLYSFSLHRVWTFSGEHKHSPKRQLIAYSSLALINVLLTSILIAFQVNTVGIPPFIAKLVCMALVVVWNFLLLNRIIFARTS